MGTNGPVDRQQLVHFGLALRRESMKFTAYREDDMVVCRRELRDGDGARHVMQLVSRDVDEVAEFVRSDPYYPKLRAKFDQLLLRLRMRASHGR